MFRFIYRLSHAPREFFTVHNAKTYATMLTIVVGYTGTLFRAPADTVNLDERCDIDDMDAVRVAFSVHKFMVSAVSDYILGRFFQRKSTTIFLWNNELPLIEHLLPHTSAVVYQHDTCANMKCMQDVAQSYMRSDGAWFPLCWGCLERVQKQKAIKRDRERERSYRDSNPDRRIQSPE